MTSIPEEMLAVRLVASVPNQWQPEHLQNCVRVEKIPVPKPAFGQVLIKMERSVINPSDLMTLTGNYDPSNRKEPPFTPGREGCGQVVSSGGGFMAWSLLGKRVAVVTDGAWAEYAVADCLACLTVPGSMSWEDCSAAFVNPLSVLGMLEIAYSGGHKTVLHTAAASALGKMLIKQGKRSGIDVICVVRKEEQAKECAEAGATLILNTSDDGFDAKLREMAKKHNCKLAFDAVAGELTGRILSAMPEGSEVKVYGGLSGKAVSGINPQDLIFAGKTVGGFWLLPYIRSKSKLGLYMWTKTVVSLLQKEFATKVAKQFPIGEAAQAIGHYANNMSAGKVLIVCSKSE